MKLVETVDYKDCYLDIYKSSSWLEKVYTGMSDNINFYSHSTDKDLVIIRFKEAVDKRLEDSKSKVTVENLDKKVAELVKEIAYLNKKLREKEVIVIPEPENENTANFLKGLAFLLNKGRLVEISPYQESLEFIEVITPEVNLAWTEAEQLKALGWIESQLCWNYPLKETPRKKTE